MTMKYRIYTKEFDVIISAEKLLAIRSQRRISSTLRLWKYRLRTRNKNALVNKALYELEGRLADKVDFLRQNVAVTLLIDHSGSLNNHRALITQPCNQAHAGRITIFEY